MTPIALTPDYATAATDAIEALEALATAAETARQIDADWATGLAEALESAAAALEPLDMGLALRAGTEGLQARLLAALHTADAAIDG